MNARTTSPCSVKKQFYRQPLGIMIALALTSLSSNLLAEDTLVVSADGGAGAPAESAWGPAATIAAKQSATGTKTDTPIEKIRSLFPW